MPTAASGTIRVDLVAATDAYEKGLRRAQQETAKFGNGLSGTGNRGRMALQQLAFGAEDASVSFGTGGLAGAVRGATNNLTQMLSLMGGSLGTIASFGVAAAFLAKAIGDMARAPWTKFATGLASLESTAAQLVKLRQEIRDLQSQDELSNFTRRNNDEIAQLNASLDQARTNLNTMQTAQNSTRRTTDFLGGAAAGAVGLFGSDARKFAGNALNKYFGTVKEEELDAARRRVEDLKRQIAARKESLELAEKERKRIVDTERANERNARFEKDLQQAQRGMVGKPPVYTGLLSTHREQRAIAEAEMAALEAQLGRRTARLGAVGAVDVRSGASRTAMQQASRAGVNMTAERKAAEERKKQTERLGEIRAQLRELNSLIERAENAVVLGDFKEDRSF